MHEIRRIARGPLAVACVLLLSFPAGQPVWATMLAGGGPSPSDCYVTLDVPGSRAATAANVLECQDGDPTCDQDGTCNNACRFRVAVCVNQPGLPGCTPPAALQSVSGKVKGVPLAVPVLSGAACGAPTDLDVPQKSPTR